MLSPARFPLGAPGVFTLPEVAAPTLHPERMDVCAFVGVAPRGPARVPIVDASHPVGWRRVVDDRPLQRSVPVLVRSFDEYVRQFGAFEGPGLLPHAVASYFEQGGKLAWIVRVVPERSNAFDHRCARGNIPGGAKGALTQDLTLIARSEGVWGNQLGAQLAFDTTTLAFSLGPGGRIEVDPRAPVLPGTTLRFTDADGRASLSVCERLGRVRDLAQARERLVLVLDVAPPHPPVQIELVEARLDLSDSAGRREHFEHLALVPDHPQSLANVLCQASQLVWPHPDWAGSTLRPRDPRVELIVTPSGPFTGGDDAWEQLTPDDFFDPAWSAAEDQPGGGITAVTGLTRQAAVTQLVVPDLYLPAQWAGLAFIDAVPAGGAGAEFSDCVNIAAIAAEPGSQPSSLTGLIRDPRTLAGLADVVALQQRVLDICESTQDLIALLDVPPGLSQGRIESWRARFDSAWCAAYHPWLIPARRNFEDSDPALARERRLPPSAVAAGIVAQRELERGIQWGPANEVARQIVHVAEPQPEGRVDALHPLGINCFVRDVQGLRLVAARTLSRDPDWRQLSVRRLMLMLRRTLLAQMQWAVFEPNNEKLWRDLRLAIESLLRQLFRAGVFAGRTEAESFFVRLLTEPQRLDRGELVVEIGVAPAEPLEFILVRLRRDGDGTLNLED